MVFCSVVQEECLLDTILFCGTGRVTTRWYSVLWYRYSDHKMVFYEAEYRQNSML